MKASGTTYTTWDYAVAVCFTGCLVARCAWRGLWNGTAFSHELDRLDRDLDEESQDLEEQIERSKG